MADKKFSEFAPGGAIKPTDTVVGLRSGVNTEFDGTFESSAQVAGLDDALDLLTTKTVGLEDAVDDLEAEKVAKAGDTMTGALTLHSSSPAADLEAASKGYVDNHAGTIVTNAKSGVNYATTSTDDYDAVYDNGVSGVGATLTMNNVGQIQCDGSGVGNSYRILVKNQSNSIHNGIYFVTFRGDGVDPGILTRATDYDTVDKAKRGSYTAVVTGAENAGKVFSQSTPVALIGSDDINFTAQEVLGLNSRVIYITPDADDAAATGNYLRPFTLDGALSYVIDQVPSITNKFLLSLAAGNYTVADLQLPPFIGLLGAGKGLTNITVGNNIVGFHSSWDGETAGLSIRGISFIETGFGFSPSGLPSPVNITLNFQELTVDRSCNIASLDAANFIRINAINCDMVRLPDLGYGVNLDGVAWYADGGEYVYPIVLTDIHSPTTAEFRNARTGAAVTITGSLIFFKTLSCNKPSMITITGDGTYSTDSASYTEPTIMSGTPFVELYDNANSVLVDYVPANYSPANDQVAGHLEGIDNALAIAAGSAAISFHVYQGSAQTIPDNATPTKITLDTLRFNNGGFFDVGDSSFTPPAGVYMLMFQGQMEAPVADVEGVFAIFNNGVERGEARWIIPAGVGDITFTIPYLFETDGTQELDVRCAMVGEALDINALSARTYFTGFVIGEQNIKNIVAVSGTSKTLALSDAYTLQNCSNGATQTLTIPPASSVAFTTGTQIDFAQSGAGQVVFAAGVGVTIRSKLGNLKLAAQYSAGTATYLGSDVWLLVGDLAA